MNVFATIALSLIAAQDLPKIETDDPPPIEQRVTTLEMKVASIERQLAGKPLAVVPTVKETYEAGRARAIREGKPMVVWVGDAVCPACVEANKDEFVHHVTPKFHGLTNALVVGLPVNGELIRVADKLSWPEGHIPTVRQAIQEYRDRRSVFVQTPPTTLHRSQFQPQYQPQRRMRSG